MKIDKDKYIQELVDEIEALKVKLSTAENIIDYIPGIIYWKNKNGEYLGCNQYAVDIMFQLGVIEFADKNAIIGKSDKDFFNEQTAKQYVENDKKVIASKEPIINEEKLELPDGTFIEQLSIKQALVDSAGDVIGTIGNTVDITKQKQLEKELKSTQSSLLQANQDMHKANKVKTEFIENMSHDIRTPITGIIGVSGIIYSHINSIQQKYGGLINCELKRFLDDLKNYSNLISGATKKLLDLSNEILEVVALKSNHSFSSSKLFSPKSIIEDALILMLPTAINRSLSLTCEIDDSIPDQLVGFPVYFKRTLINLISNALKFTDNGFVKIIAKKKNIDSESGTTEALVVTIADSGIGIPENKFDFIFENFSRLNPSFEGVYNGAGLGLYTVKQYVQRMNGEISIQSQLGQGSQFTFTIPIHLQQLTDESDSNTLSVNHDQPLTSGPQCGLRILIVEDNAMAMLASRAALESFDCKVMEAVNGAQALEMAATHGFDLILLDIGLPDISGIDVAKKIRQQEQQSQHTPAVIVALTAHAAESSWCQRAREAGIQNILTKPADHAQLSEIVNMVSKGVVD